MMRRGQIWLAAAVATVAPAHAQAPVPAPPPASTPFAPVADSAVQSFYAARPRVLVWFKDADTRAAAAKLPAILRRAPIDGLADGAVLAAEVESAIARGQQSDDMIVSAAWVRYVRTLKSPVEGINYGDAALQMQPPSTEAVLAQARLAPSLAAHVDAIAAVNSLYSELRAEVERQGNWSDPRVRATLDRLRLIPAKGPAILVDVASARLLMLEDGRPVDTMKVVVGKKDAATPLIASTIHYVTFNPYWHIPQDVARRKVAPIVLKRGVKYLKAARYETVAAFGGDKEEAIDPASVDWKAVAAGDIDVHIRQLTGPNNMMGKMKFGFVNDYGIFLHDTPHKELFAKDKRNLSLGCIRLERPEALARWLLGREPESPSGSAEELVLIDKGVPVFVSYLTATPGDAGAIAFAEDVYGLDTPGGGKAVMATASSAQ
jgi:murein L,D-transpeptidase YcbB/YkuD